MPLSNLNAIFQADLAFAYGEVGSVVVYGNFSAGGVLIHEPVDVLQMGLKQYAVSDTEITLTIAAGSLGTLSNNSSLMVDGKSYLIHKYIPVNDGLETKLWLSEA